MKAKQPTILVIGASILGVGIAQVAAQSGHSVLLCDLREGAAAQALLQLGKTLTALVANGLKHSGRLVGMHFFNPVPLIGALLGRKSGRGFFNYGEGAQRPSIPNFESADLPPASSLRVLGQGQVAERLAATLTQAGQTFERQTHATWVGLEVGGAQLRLTDGATASELGHQVVLFDLPLPNENGAALAWAPAVQASVEWIKCADQWLRALGFNPHRVADTPGLRLYGWAASSSADAR